MTGGDGFLSRWSRRKRGTDPGDADPDPAAAALSPPVPSAPEPVDAGADPADAAARSDAEILAELGLKHPDEMGPGEDFAGFLRAQVPAHLKRLALRKLWRSNPVLANLDGLNDYDTDFTGDTVAPGMLQTAYKVGTGLIRDLPLPAPDAAPPEPAPAAAPDAVAADDHAREVDPPAMTEHAGFPESAAVTEENAQDAGNDAPTRRRMSFRFDA